MTFFRAGLGTRAKVWRLVALFFLLAVCGRTGYGAGRAKLGLRPGMIRDAKGELAPRLDWHGTDPATGHRFSGRAVFTIPFNPITPLESCEEF